MALWCNCATTTTLAYGELRAGCNHLGFTTKGWGILLHVIHIPPPPSFRFLNAGKRTQISLPHPPTLGRLSYGRSGLHRCWSKEGGEGGDRETWWLENSKTVSEFTKSSFSGLNDCMKPEISSSRWPKASVGGEHVVVVDYVRQLLGVHGVNWCPYFHEHVKLFISIAQALICGKTESRLLS